MIDSITKWVLAAGIAVLLFLVLDGSRWLLTPSERGAVSVQNSYDELAASLAQENLLPLQDEDVLLMAFAGLAISTGQISEPLSLGGGVRELNFGQVIRGVSANGQVNELWLDPQRWREVNAGRLREALQVISRLPLSKQAGTTQGSKSMPVMSTSFQFSATVRSETYIFTPFFDGQKCNRVRIKRE